MYWEKKMAFPRHRSGLPKNVSSLNYQSWPKNGLLRTTVAHGYGGRICTYSSEPARTEIYLLGMQGLGRPGVNQLTFVEGTMLGSYTRMRAGKGQVMGMLTPNSIIRPMVNAAYRGYIPFMFKQESMIPKTMLHDVIESGKYDIYGSSDQMDPVEDQFRHLSTPCLANLIHMLKRYTVLLPAGRTLSSTLCAI
jgi:hypothetical protein